MWCAMHRTVRNVVRDAPAAGWYDDAARDALTSAGRPRRRPLDVPAADWTLLRSTRCCSTSDDLTIEGVTPGSRCAVLPRAPVLDLFSLTAPLA